MHVEAIASTHPRVGGHIDDALVHCIELCFDCSKLAPPAPMHVWERIPSSSSANALG